jgi:hypothetical protein
VVLAESETMDSFANPNYTHSMSNEDFLNCNSPCDNGYYRPIGGANSSRLGPRFNASDNIRSSFIPKSTSLYSTFSASRQADYGYSANDACTSGVKEKRWPHEYDDDHLIDERCEVVDTDEPMEDCCSCKDTAQFSSSVGQENTETSRFVIVSFWIIQCYPKYFGLNNELKIDSLATPQVVLNLEIVDKIFISINHY